MKELEGEQGYYVYPFIGHFASLVLRVRKPEKYVRGCKLALEFLWSQFQYRRTHSAKNRNENCAHYYLHVYYFCCKLTSTKYNEIAAISSTVITVETLVLRKFSTNFCI